MSQPTHSTTAQHAEQTAQRLLMLAKRLQSPVARKGREAETWAELAALAETLAGTARELESASKA